MLETLIDRQNHHFAGAGKFTGHQNSGDVRFRPRVVAFVVGQNFLNALGDFHIVVRSKYAAFQGPFWI